MSVSEATVARVGSAWPNVASAPHAVAADTAIILHDVPASPHIAIALQTAASLLWIPQAGLIAFAIGGIAGDAPAQAAIAPAIGILLLGILRAVLERNGSRIAWEAARRCLGDARARAGKALARRSPLDASRPSSGLAASVLAEQAEAIVPYFARFRPLRVRAALVPLVIFCVVLSLSWAAALVLLIAAPVIPLFMALIGWQAKETSERQLLHMGDMNAFLLDRLRGLATIRAFGAVDHTARQLHADAEALRVSTMAVLRIAFLSSAVLELFAAIGVAMVAVYVGFHFLGELQFGAWGSKLSLAQGLFILLLSPAFFEPLRELSSVWHDWASGQVSLEAVERLLAPGAEIIGMAEDAGAPCSSPPLSVQVEGLRFFHRDRGQSCPSLDGLDLHVRAGEHVAVMAPSGGGKSTLLALLAGLAAPQAGSIRLGGEPLNGLTAARLRARMAWLGQPPHLFSATLRGNIALGRANIGLDEVHQAMQIARIDRIAAQRGNAPIGENGAGLSGGETLRLAIARAAVGRRAGLILVDEPTAHLDGETANKVIEGLLAVAAGTTLIVATHDPVLAARMDRVIELPVWRVGQ